LTIAPGTAPVTFTGVAALDSLWSMALTADDIHNIAFRKAPLGRRGYDEEQVDAFLDQVEATITDLRAQLARQGGGEAPIDATLLSELGQIKQRLTQIEAALRTG
jgi:DivIVA domain-containing protein